MKAKVKKIDPFKKLREQLQKGKKPRVKINKGKYAGSIAEVVKTFADYNCWGNYTKKVRAKIDGRSNTLLFSNVDVMDYTGKLPTTVVLNPIYIAKKEAEKKRLEEKRANAKPIDILKQPIKIGDTVFWKYFFYEVVDIIDNDEIKIKSMSSMTWDAPYNGWVEPRECLKATPDIVSILTMKKLSDEWPKIVNFHAFGDENGEEEDW